MIITCPNCQTRYSVDPRALGDSGKAVRCSNCGTKWHQSPHQPPPLHRAMPIQHLQPQPQPQPQRQGGGRYQPQPMYPPAPAYAAPPQFAYGAPPGFGFPSPPMYPPGAWPMPPLPPGYPAPPGGYPPPLQPDSAFNIPPPPEPQAIVMPDLEPEPEPELSLPPVPDEMFAPLPEPEPEYQPEPEPEPVFQPEPEPVADEPRADEVPMSQQELDTMFGQDEDPVPVESIVESGYSREPEGEDEELDEYDEPGPIPRGIAAHDEDMEEEGSSRKKLALLTVIPVVVLLGLGAGLYFGRDLVIQYVPGAKAFYSMLGGSEALGAGLELRAVKSEREIEAGQDVLVVRGQIANISDMPRKVPGIRVSLMDNEGHEVQAVTVEPDQPEVAPNESTTFKARLENPAATARRLEVAFAPPAPAGGDREPKH